jgi:hypothetical protein
MNKLKKMNLATNIISIGFLIGISILLSISGVVFPNIYVSAADITPYKLNGFIITILALIFGSFILYNIYLNKKLKKLEVKEVEKENKTN